MKPRVRKLLWVAPLAILGIMVFMAIGGTIVMALWNWLLPALFGWREINFWQALGLLMLCRILFGGFGLNGSRSHRRHRMKGRWEGMTSEERERFRQGMHEHWGFGQATGETKEL